MRQMPVFDFKCKRCGKVSEILLKGIDEAESQACPHCGSRGMKRLLSAPSAVVAKHAGDSPKDGGSCCGRGTPCDSLKHCCRD